MESFLKNLLKILLKLCFRVRVGGLDRLAQAGDRVVIVANHQSFLDPMLLAVFMPEKPAFAMNSYQAEKWYFKPLMKPFEIFRIDPSKPMSTKSLIAALRKGRKVVIFPEGRITSTGGLMKIYDGSGMIIDRTDATIIPVRIDGAQFSKFSRMQGKSPLRWFPRVTITFMPPQKMKLPADMPARQRRKAAGQKLYRIMSEAMFHGSRWNNTILKAAIENGYQTGFSRELFSDVNRVELSLRQLFIRSYVLSSIWRERMIGEKNIGVLLPTSLAGLVSFVSLHLAGKVPAMINFASGNHNILHARHTAQLSSIITSRRFVQQGKLEAVIEALKPHCKIFYLEDIRDEITTPQRLCGLIKGWFPRLFLPKATPGDNAVILFTSGSEGTPKGVVLSHANIMGNLQQAIARIDLAPEDVVFNALPMFHSFGLSIGTLLPLTRGMKVFFYPTPLHYRVIPELCYDTSATIMLGTDTFFNGYARYAHPYDFYNVRFAVAGAERLREETRQLYLNKFGVTILQGYGVTETSPVISVNTPLEHKPGTVGVALPGIECRLEAIEGLEGAGRLWVRGPNVMLGYMRGENPGEVQVQDDWYDTGDIVSIDDEGFLTIQGRAKRFAKIGGEMVSLGAVEECAAALWPDAAHAAIAIADPRKGEQVVLVTEEVTAERISFSSFARERGLPEISFPRKVMNIDTLPRLGSGKLDYISIQQWVTDNQDR